MSSTLISALVGALSAWLAESTSFVTCSKVPVVSCETFTVCTSVITPSIPKMVRTVLMVDCKFNPVSESKTDDVSSMSVVNDHIKIVKFVYIGRVMWEGAEKFSRIIFCP